MAATCLMGTDSIPCRTQTLVTCIFVLLQFKYQFGCTNFYLCGTGAFEIGIQYLGLGRAFVVLALCLEIIKIS